MLTYILFVLGFPLLIKGADLLVEGASSVAKKYKIPSIVIGLTIVSFGTSLPEFVVSILASLRGSSSLAIGNILGSNIANILLILGVTAIIYPITAKRNTVIKEIPFSLLAALMVGILSADIRLDGQVTAQLSRIDGLVLLSFLIFFMYYIFGISKNLDEITPEEPIKILSSWRSTIYILIGLVALGFGGHWIVEGAIVIAKNFNVSETIIGLTIVAIGTSLPELATSVVAAFKKQSDIAIGNIVGSNILNIFWILGFSALISPIAFSANLEFDIIINIFTSIILLFAMSTGRKLVLERSNGIVLLICYGGYLIIRIMQSTQALF